MATIVRFRGNGGEYILLGGGFGSYRSKTPHVFFGDWAPEDIYAEIPVAFLCDHAGKTGWVRSEQIEVISVDGRSPEEILDDPLPVEPEDPA